jgi:hypothetical protein
MSARSPVFVRLAGGLALFPAGLFVVVIVGQAIQWATFTKALSGFGLLPVGDAPIVFGAFVVTLELATVGALLWPRTRHMDAALAFLLLNAFFWVVVSAWPNSRRVTALHSRRESLISLWGGASRGRISFEHRLLPLMDDLRSSVTENEHPTFSCMIPRNA